MSVIPCGTCSGQRLNAQARSVSLTTRSARFSDHPQLTLPEICALAISPAEDFFVELDLDKIGQNRLLSLVYSAADVYVIPSLQDNLPSTVLEAMACGTPVVGFDVGGVPEMVRPGLTGALAAVGDVRALATTIESLLVEPEGRRKMAAICRRVALEEYRMELYVRRYEELYQSLVEQNAGYVPAASASGAKVGVWSCAVQR